MKVVNISPLFSLHDQKGFTAATIRGVTAATRRGVTDTTRRGHSRHQKGVTAGTGLPLVLYTTMALYPSFCRLCSHHLNLWLRRH